MILNKSSYLGQPPSYFWGDLSMEFQAVSQCGLCNPSCRQIIHILETTPD